MLVKPTLLSSILFLSAAALSAQDIEHSFKFSNDCAGIRVEVNLDADTTWVTHEAIVMEMVDILVAGGITNPASPDDADALLNVRVIVAGNSFLIITAFSKWLNDASTGTSGHAATGAYWHVGANHGNRKQRVIAAVHEQMDRFLGDYLPANAHCIDR